MRKIGLHLLHHPPQGEIIALVKKLRPRVIKAVSDGNYLPLLADALKNELDYEPVFVQRNWFENKGAGHPNFYTGQSVDQFIGAVRQTLEATRGRDNFYWESYNETGVSPQYVAFERDRVLRLKNEFGVRSLVLNMGVGWSTREHVIMALDAGLLGALKGTGGAWGEHAYGSVLGMQMYHGPENQAVEVDGRLGRAPKEMAFDHRIWPDTVASWLAFRPSMTHQNLISVGFGDIPIIISEFGFDDAGFQSYRHYTGGAHVSAWRECIPYWQNLGYLDGKSAEQFYGEQLAWAENQFSVYPWLMGATVFTVGSDLASRWAMYDVINTSVFDYFLAALGTVPEPEPQPEPQPIPEFPPVEGCYITPSDGRVNVRRGPSIDEPIVGKIEVGEANKALAIYHEAPGRMWYRIVGGYAASWVVTAFGGCEELPDETPKSNEGENAVKNIGLVYRDHDQMALGLSALAYDAGIFVSMGEPRYAARAKISDFIARIWIQYNQVELSRGLPDYGNSDSFMSKVGELPIVDIVYRVLLEATPLKNYISEVQHYRIYGNSPEHPEIPNGETRKLENPDYSAESIIELLNGDGVQEVDLGNYFAVEALALEQLHHAVDPATRQTVERDLRGAVISRNIDLDPDREAFWNLAINRGLLKAVIDYDARILLKRKVTGRIAAKRERDVMPFVDMMILAREGFGSAKVVLQVEYADGWASQPGMEAEHVAADLWLLAKTAATYDNLEVVFFLRQQDDTGDWGDKHDVRGAVEEIYLDYLSGARPAPDVEWLTPEEPPDDEPPPDEEPPPNDDEDETPTEPSIPVGLSDFVLDYLRIQRDQYRMMADRLEQLIQKYALAAN